LLSSWRDLARAGARRLLGGISASSGSRTGQSLAALDSHILGEQVRQLSKEPLLFAAAHASRSSTLGAQTFL
jgi:hypothetical protein